MDPEARVAFLARFEAGRAPVLGFVVLGGVFAESVDLPGDRLVGILVAGIGLPPPTLEREAERAAFGEMGRLVAYLHPAVSRVVQAAGRIIRGPEDRGVVCLVDDRFTGRDLRALLPQHWRPEIVRADGLRTRLDRFWQNR
jgi:Rad3-related DNA helicase